MVCACAPQSKKCQKKESFPPSSPSPAMEHPWIDFARYCDGDRVETFLRDNPDVDVNVEDQWAWTFLHPVANNGDCEVVKILLAHPNINANPLDNVGRTPFVLACDSGQVEMVLLLLKDSRVNAALADANECSPLWYAE